MDIRILLPGEESILGCVAPEVFDNPIDERATREFLDDPHHHLAVALDGDTVVGFASAVHYLHPDKPRPEMWINEVAVAPTHRGRGIGKAVVRAITELARELGCTEAWLLTERDNAPALALYRSLGAEEEKDESVMFTFQLPDRPSA